MRQRSLRFSALGALALATLFACGARSGLPGPSGGGGSSSTTTTTASGGGGATTSTSATGGEGGTPPLCVEGQTLECGSDIGACKKGLRTCHDQAFGPCEGAVGPVPEACNGVDDNCDGQIDEGFHLGEACDGPDTDLCMDDVMTCAGCSTGPNNLEICNGIDDNCNGIIDADCDTGDCQPKLEVTGSQPSNPNCIDFPVEKGSTGIIEYPCGGGPVTAQLGSIFFTGSVSNGVVSLDGTGTVVGPDTCTWHTFHHIGGTISTGQLTYSYAEQVDPKPGVNCWQPCTEVGTVQIHWAGGP